MARISESILEEIKQLNDIVDVVGEVVDLRKNGNLYIGLCPFHNEDTPSFTVYPETQSYACYGCGAGKRGSSLPSGGIDAGNDVLGFVQNYYHLGFREACIKLMQRAGMPESIEPVDPEIDKLKQDMLQDNRLYWQTLQEHLDVLQYLYDRGLNDESIDKFRLGLVPSDFPKHIRNRLSFAIMNNNEETVAMAYRTLDNSQPKYRNDKNSRIFNKSSTLYLLSHAHTSIRQLGYAVVVEGYFDAILAHQHGLQNTVATMGTTFTSEQMIALRKHTDKVYLWYDNDKAGRNASYKALPQLLAHGFTVMFTETEAGDPAEFITSLDDPSELEAQLHQHSKHALQAIITQELSHYDAIINDARVKTLDKLLPVIDSIQQPTEKLVFEQTVMKHLGLR